LAVVLIVIAMLSCAAIAGPSSYSKNFNLPIPSAIDPHGKDKTGWMDEAFIEINTHRVIEDLDVYVSLTHGSFFDLQISVQSPAGTNVILNPIANLAFIVRGPDGKLKAMGGSKQLLFDDESEVSIEEAEPPFLGPFKPAGLDRLASFDGEDIFGVWRLKIYDGIEGDSGTLHKVGLIVSAPEPATILLFALGALLAGPCRRKFHFA